MVSRSRWRSEACICLSENLVDGDAVHHVEAAERVFVVEHVGSPAVLDDGRLLVVGADLGDVCRAVEGDHGAIEASRHMDGRGIVGDDERGTGDEGHQVGDAGFAEAVDDGAVGGCGGEERAALITFGSGADDDDGVELIGVAAEEFAGDGGEAIGGPAFAGPAAGGGENRVAFGAEVGVGVEAGECVGRRVEAQVADGVDVEGREEFEHAVNGVRLADRGGDGVSERAALAGIGGADADGCAGHAGEEGAAGEALGVDDEVVVSAAQAGEEGAKVVQGAG